MSDASITFCKELRIICLQRKLPIGEGQIFHSGSAYSIGQLIIFTTKRLLSTANLHAFIIKHSTERIISVNCASFQKRKEHSSATQFIQVALLCLSRKASFIATFSDKQVRIIFRASVGSKTSRDCYAYEEDCNSVFLLSWIGFEYARSCTSNFRIGNKNNNHRISKCVKSP